MSLPSGYYADKKASSSTPLVCKLHKSIYGLKQASRQLFFKFSSILTANDVIQFIHQRSWLFLCCTSCLCWWHPSHWSNDAIASTKARLQSNFKLKDLGHATYFLGLELSGSSIGIYISQHKYCLRILNDCGFITTKLAPCPMVTKLKLTVSSGKVLSADDAFYYRRLISRLLNLQISRPNICFSVHKLS